MISLAEQSQTEPKTQPGGLPRMEDADKIRPEPAGRHGGPVSTGVPAAPGQPGASQPLRELLQPAGGPAQQPQTPTPQKPRPFSPQDEPDRTTSYLHLVLRIDETGNTEVVSAIEVPGRTFVSEEILGDFVYSLDLGQETLLVQAVPDPFELRSFPGPAGSGREGHHFLRAPEATLVVKVPAAERIKPKLDQLRLRTFRLRGEVVVERINADVLSQLVGSSKLEPLGEVPGRQLGKQIKEKLSIVP